MDRGQIIKNIGDLERLFDSNVLFYYGELRNTNGIVQYINETRNSFKNNFILFLISKGGDTTHTLNLKNIFNRFEVLVPFGCFSNATVLALYSSKIYYSNSTQFSPIDIGEEKANNNTEQDFDENDFKQVLIASVNENHPNVQNAEEFVEWIYHSENFCDQHNTPISINEVLSKAQGINAGNIENSDIMLRVREIQENLIHFAVDKIIIATSSCLKEYSI